MNICYIASVRIPNEKASGLAIMRQCEAFAKIGNDVVLLRPYRSNHITEDPFVFYGIEKIFAIQTMSSFDFHQSLDVLGFYIARLSQMVSSFFYILKNTKSIDIVYARDPWMLFLPTLLLRQKKIIWEAHQMQKGWVVRCVARRVQLLVCISKGLQNYYAEFRKDKRILVEPSGVNIEQFQNLPSVEDVRVRYGVPLDKKVIGYTGKYTTMGEGKGVDELIEAFALVSQKYQHLYLLIVGLEDTEMEVVKMVCQKNGIADDKYTLLPLIQKDFALYVHMADILVMNYPNTEHYRNYMSPTKLFAYMASKKKVVASDLLSIRYIANESMITLVKPDSVESLIKGITDTLIQNDSEKQEQALLRVREYAWKPRALRILDTL